MKLSLTERTGIINELGTMQNIRACLDVVEIAMGFLATGAQNANNSLGDYIDTALRMKKRLNSEKVSYIDSWCEYYSSNKLCTYFYRYESTAICLM